MYVQSHVRLWIINNYNNIFYTTCIFLCIFYSHKRKRKKFPNFFSKRINITILRDNKKNSMLHHAVSIIDVFHSHSRLIIPTHNAT